MGFISIYNQMLTNDYVFVTIKFRKFSLKHQFEAHFQEKNWTFSENILLLGVLNKNILITVKNCKRRDWRGSSKIALGAIF